MWPKALSPGRSVHDDTYVLPALVVALPLVLAAVALLAFQRGYLAARRNDDVRVRLLVDIVGDATHGSLYTAYNDGGTGSTADDTLMLLPAWRPIAMLASPVAVPADAVQEESVRMMYVHVPTAIVAFTAYLTQLYGPMTMPGPSVGRG